MPLLLVEITRFVDEHQPGFVECKFIDAIGQAHQIIEKAPVVSAEDLWSTSCYPRIGQVQCEVEAKWQSNEGLSLVRVNTERPFGIESSTGETKFVVLSSQVITP